MAFKSCVFLSISLYLLVVFHVGSAQWGSREQHPFGGQQFQPFRVRADECRLSQLRAQQPNLRIRSEAGETHFWDRNSPEFVCAGIEVVRYVIQPRGLLLPGYANAPMLFFNQQGRCISGVVVPGCAETYETVRSESQIDRHQKLRRFQEGEVHAMPTGITHWFYNDGDRDLVLVALIDTSNEANQLDQNFRKFFLAGNPQGQERQGQQGQKREMPGNLFQGFDENLIANSLNIDAETARKLMGRNDERGSIVRAENLRFLNPELEQEQQQQGGGGRYNGFEETICTARLIQNIASPRLADVFNPRGGRIGHVNRHKLPILNMLQLSAERGILYRNAIKTPHWNINSHSVILILRGNGRMQIVGNEGRAVFDERVEEGQLIVVPQNFAEVKKAGEEGLEWIAFKTHGDAMISPIAGRTSALRAMPDDVVAQSFQISRQEARNIKNSRQETTVLSPRERSQRQVA